LHTEAKDTPAHKKCKSDLTESYYVASVLELRGCHTQARSLDKLMERIREPIELCLEVERDVPTTEFIGVQRIAL
jgi:predicted RNase H-like HicB family nuclease